jgi:hypothetical protein
MQRRHLADGAVVVHAQRAVGEGVVQLQHPVVEGDVALRRLGHVAQPHAAQALGHGLAAEVIEADHPQGHVHAVAGGVVDEVQRLRVVFDAGPVHVVGDGDAADLGDLLAALRQHLGLQLVDLAAFLQSHDRLRC